MNRILSEKYQNYFNRIDVRFTMMFFILFLCYLILFLQEAAAVTFLVVGGIIGFLSTCVVLNGLIRNKEIFGETSALLFYRTCCDLLLSVRYIVNPAFSYMVCGSLNCNPATSDSSNCFFASFIAEFFGIASECWFLCNGIDLYVSITNPFSSFKKRLRYYHIFVWITSILFSIGPFFSLDTASIYGFWFVGVCFIVKSNFGALIGLYFGPLIAVYACCIVILVITYSRLKRGITNTFLFRMKLLLGNTANLLCLLCYWFLVIVFYFSAYATDPNRNDDWDTNDEYTGNSYVFLITVFLIGSKGFTSLFIYVLIMDISQKLKFENQENIDANIALREEILSFITAGIRSSTRASSRASPDKEKMVRRPKEVHSQAASNKGITPIFFFRFMIGLPAEVAAVERMMKDNQRRVNNNYMKQFRLSDMSSNQDTLGGSESKLNFDKTHKEENPSIVSSNFSEMGGVPDRFSQRATFVVGDKVDDNNNNNIEMTNSFQSDTASELGNKMHADFRQSEMEEIEDNTESVDDTSSAFNDSLRGNAVSYFLHKITYHFRKPVIDASDWVEFTEYAPYQFREIRLAFGITDALFVDCFSTTIKERLTEGGASGAFFFFSKDELLIAKSCTLLEMDTIRHNADRYMTYLKQNKDSFIIKVFGAYRLQIYGNSLYFFVMNNIFLNPERLTMHEKYDIKGSWFNRNAKPPRDGQRKTCTHCEQKFTYRKKKKLKKERLFSSALNPLQSPTASTDDSHITDMTQYCPYTVSGHHEPNLILKDNDLKFKIRLPADTATLLYTQLYKDVEFLGSMNVMDYSLLIGVHNTEYEVQKPKTDVGKNNNTTTTNNNNNPENEEEEQEPLTKSAHNPMLAVSEEILKRQSDFLKKRSSRINVPLSYTNSVVSPRKLEVVKVFGPDAYYVGIIDFQQTWTFSKKLERFMKIQFYGADPDGVSVINPDLYKERFLRKVEDILDVDLREPSIISPSSIVNWRK